MVLSTLAMMMFAMANCDRVTGHCNPNTEASRIGGYTTNTEYDGLQSCYDGRCANEPTCVAASFGGDLDECVAYTECTDINPNALYETVYKAGNAGAGTGGDGGGAGGSCGDAKNAKENCKELELAEYAQYGRR